jgi:hypothetical protein
VEPHPSSSSVVIQLLLLAVFIIPAILFLLTQQNTLKMIRPENRRMAPGLVWLQLIPLLGQVWQFFVVTRTSGSIQSELESPRGDSILGVSDVFMANSSRRQPTRAIGIAYCILYWLLLLAEFANEGRPMGAPAPLLMVVGLFVWATVICWIVYWAKLAWYKRKLKVLLVLA